ncbi:MAG TPA: hypothetical protein VF628_11440 [Allosphingosinicella sp.]
MTSPYLGKSLEDWLFDLNVHLEVLAEESVDLSGPQEATVEFAGSPEVRARIQADLQQLGWTAFRGVGQEPDATVILAKSAVWSSDVLRFCMESLFHRAKEEGAIFEGIYVSNSDTSNDA